MPRMRMVDGQLIEMTSEEEAEHLACLPVAAKTVEDFRRAIQGQIDACARDRSYDSGITCASYAGSTNPVWAAEAAAFIAWRDAVWAYAYAELAKVQAGQREAPTVEAFLAELPALSWPQ